MPAKTKASPSDLFNREYKTHSPVFVLHALFRMRTLEIDARLFYFGTSGGLRAIRPMYLPGNSGKSRQS
jgi:hypothetical protein